MFLNKKMKLIKKNRIILLTTLLLFLTCFKTFSRNVVDNITIDVDIHDNGSATITQRWSGNFDEGTEIYIPIEDKNLYVKNLKVWLNSEEYINTDGWDVNWSFNQKKLRAGINKTNKGVELCFGITNYGANTYTFTYDIDPLVKSYKESDGFNFQFVNQGMSIFPTNVILRIRLDDGKMLSSENARVWAFGYNGNVQFTDDGYIAAYSYEPLRGKNYMNITLEMYKGLLLPNVSVDNTFKSAILDVALENSSYEKTLNSSFMEGLFYKFIFFTVFLIIILNIISKIKRKIELKKFYKNCEYYRDNPNDNDILMTNTLYNDFDIWHNKKTNIIGAMIMKMINDGNLKPVKETNYGLFGLEKVSTSLKVGTEPQDMYLKELYDIIIKAAGDDGVLQENEMKKYATRNYEVLNDYLNSLNAKGHSIISKKDCYNKVYGTNLKDLTDIGKGQLSQVYGLRKFLYEFTLISERSITEGVIWENLIVYATLFGIADKVLNELKRLYPDKIVEIEEYSNTYYISNLYYRSLYYNTLGAKRAAMAKAAAIDAAKGLGGLSSMTGGAGFSGGGSGGGTR